MFFMQELKDWVEEAKEGVIYFSFGSNFQGVSLPADIREAFISSFSKFPNTRFLWKWESNSFFPGQPENVRFMKWVPQQDLLGLFNLELYKLAYNLQLHISQLNK